VHGAGLHNTFKPEAESIHAWQVSSSHSRL
jgi:hypothetical protein